MMIRPRIGDYMHRLTYSVTPEMKLEAARELMRKLDIRHLPIQRDGRLIGLVSIRDLEPPGSGADELAVSAVMRSHPFSVTADTPVAEVALEMARRRIGSAVVVSKMGEVLGIFTSIDGMRLLSEVLENSG